MLLITALTYRLTCNIPLQGFHISLFQGRASELWGRQMDKYQVNSRLTSIHSGFMVELQVNGNFLCLFSIGSIKTHDPSGKGKDQRFSQLMRT